MNFVLFSAVNGTPIKIETTIKNSVAFFIDSVCNWLHIALFKHVIFSSIYNYLLHWLLLFFCSIIVAASIFCLVPFLSAHFETK